MHDKIRIIGTTASVVNLCSDVMHLLKFFDALEETFND